MYVFIYWLLVLIKKVVVGYMRNLVVNLVICNLFIYLD